MLFTLSKVVWTLLDPQVVLFALLVAGALLLWTPWGRLGRAFASLAAIIAVLVGMTPVSEWLLVPLENRFPAIEPPPRIDGAIALGGGINTTLSQLRGRPMLNDPAERVTTLLWLQRLYPKAKFVYASGGAPFGASFKEADAARQLLAELGADTDRMIFERESRSTRENALFARELVQPRPGEVWLLVTSAYHMPRAVAVFRKIGWDVVPFPVDYVTDGEPGFTIRLHFGDGLTGTSVALKEWTGMLAYRLFGWTDEIFPRPDRAPPPS